MASKVHSTDLSSTDEATATSRFDGSCNRKMENENEYFELRIPENIVELQQTQTLSAQDLQEFEKYQRQDAIENFKLEVFRCRSCKYRCLFREEIIQHMKNVHYDVDREMSSIATVIDVLMEGLSSEVQKSQNYMDLNVNQETNVANPKLNSVNQNLNVDSSSNKIKQTSSNKGDNGLQTVGDKIVIQEMLTETQNEEQSCDSSDHAEDDTEDCEPLQTEPEKQQISNKNIVNPVLQSKVDLTAIAKSAAQCNPKATKITVFQHVNDSDTPTAIHFRKSRKSDAIIPTNDSLGILSPFLNNSYRGKKHFACSQCHSRYKTEKELTNHVQKKHQRGGQSVLCEICGLELASQISAKYHAARMHKPTGDLLKCDKCDYVTRFEKRLEIHRAKHKSEFFCEACKKSYVSLQKLEKHYQSPMHKNIINPLICEHCGYSSNKKDNFLVHMRKHTGEKPYKCNHCPYASADGSTLKKHVMAKHSNIRPFKCEYCTFSSVDKKGLTVHVRKHTGERPFRCTQCNYAAKRRSALKVHMQTHMQGSGKKVKDTVKTPPKPAQLRKIQPMPVSQPNNSNITQIQPAIAGVMQSQAQNTGGTQIQAPNTSVSQIQTPTTSVAQIQAHNTGVVQMQVQNTGISHGQTTNAGVLQIQAPNQDVHIQALTQGVGQIQAPNQGVSQIRAPTQGVAQILAPTPGVQIQAPTQGVAQIQAPAQGVAQIQAPAQGVAQIQAPTQGVAQIQAPAQGVAQIQAPAQGVAQIQAPTQGVAQIQAPAQGVAQIQTTTQGVAQIQAPTMQSQGSNAGVLQNPVGIQTSTSQATVPHNQQAQSTTTTHTQASQFSQAVTNTAPTVTTSAQGPIRAVWRNM